MAHVRSSIYLMAAITVFVSGCGEADQVERFITDTEPLDLRDPAQVKEAARYSDPLVLIFAATMPAYLELAAFRDEEEAPSCPRLINASDREAGIVDWRIEGDCGWENEYGLYRVEGSIVARGDTSGTKIQYHGFRQRSASAACEGEEGGMAVSGVVTVPFPIFPWTYDEFDDLPEEPEDMGKGHYDIHVLFETSEVDSESYCRTTKTTVAYDATIDRRLERPDGAYDWDDTSDVQGRAAVRQEARARPEDPWQPNLPPPAAWRVVAEDYGSTTSAECPDLVSGTLRIESGDDVAEFHPSAPASCFGEEKTECTAWSLNGEDQPEMCGFLWLTKGFGCSAGPDAPPPWAAMAILLAGLLWQRYRRRLQAT